MAKKIDGRKNNGCKKGENRGQGRKSKSEEYKLIDQLDSIIDPTDAIKVLHKKAIKLEDFKALEMYYKYRFGMPKQQTDITTNGKDITPKETDLSSLSATELKNMMKLMEKIENGSSND